MVTGGNQRREPDKRPAMPIVTLPNAQSEGKPDHEGDGGASSAPEPVPCPGRELKPPCAASDDNDAMGTGHGFSAGRETLI